MLGTSNHFIGRFRQLNIEEISKCIFYYLYILSSVNTLINIKLLFFKIMY